VAVGGTGVGVDEVGIVTIKARLKLCNTSELFANRFDVEVPILSSA